MTGAEFGEVDIDLLADYIGGALAGTPDESAVAALVADDPAWAAAHAELSGGMELVGAALGRLGPEPMPAELAARLESMFRPPADDTVTDHTPVSAELAAPPVPHLAAVQDRSATPGTRDHAADPEPGALPATAASARGPRGSRRPADSRPAGPADGRLAGLAGPAAGRPGRRRRWATPIAVAAGLFAFAGFGLDYLAGRSPQSEDTAANSAAGPREAAQGDADNAGPGNEMILNSGMDYTLATLAMEPPVQPLAAPEIDASGSSTSAQQRSSAAAGGSLGRLVGRAALDSCLEAIERANAGGQISVQSVDYALFNGSSALVVRFSADNGQWAWASGPECGAQSGDADTLGKVPVR